MAAEVRSYGHQRGQVLPIWIMGILATLALMFAALNYGNTLRWHIRAQSAADSAAQATLALQSERWNEMMELLYGLNVEEYRIRTLLNGILIASTGSGGCFYTNGTPQAANGNITKDCEAVYDILWPQYNKAVARYSAEALLLHRVASNATFANWYSDAQSLMNELSVNCNSPNSTTYNAAGGDCAFQYNWTVSAGSSLTNAMNQIKRSATTTPSEGGLATVYTPTATQIAIPSFGAATNYDTENASLFAPVQVDVVTCSLITPIVPAFFKLSTAPTYAIGRSAATNVMFVQDWFQPGALYNPARAPVNGTLGVDFQPPENYGTPAKPSDQEHDFYAVDFGGNAGVAKTQLGAFANAVQFDEMSVRLGWWNSIPVRPTNDATGLPNTAAKCPAGGS